MYYYSEGKIHMSRFLEIFYDLETKIINDDFTKGDLLPSEHSLSTMYQVSRETIRKALNLLLEHGYIQKIKGKGSVVLDTRRHDFPISGLTSYRELEKAQSLDSETLLFVNEKVEIPQRIALYLEVPIDTMVHHIIRGRKMNGEIIILDIDFILADVVEEIPDDKAEYSLYSYFEDELGLSIAYAQKEFTVEPTTKLDREYMSLHGDSHVVITRSNVHLEDTTSFQYTESRHRLDKFRFVEFARRRSPQSIEELDRNL